MPSSDPATQSVEEARRAVEAYFDPPYAAHGFALLEALIEAVRGEQRVVVVLQVADLDAFARGEDTEHMAGTRVHADANVRHFIAKHLGEARAVADA